MTNEEEQIIKAFKKNYEDFKGKTMKKETGSDWIDSGKYLPGEQFMGTFIMVKGESGVQIIQWVGVSYNILRGNTEWKVLPDGYCTECGAGPKEK